MFWPGIYSDIVSTVRTCKPYQVLRPSQQQEPMMRDNNVSRPFEYVSADFFTVVGKSFLIIADRHSGWPVIIPDGMDTRPPLRTPSRCSAATSGKWVSSSAYNLMAGPSLTALFFLNFMER